MRVPPYSPLRLEDFPSQKEWIGSLFLPLNSTLAAHSQALNAQITRGDNIPAFTKVFDSASLTLPLRFKLDAPFTPTQMIVGQAFKNNTAIPLVGSWSLEGDTITVNSLIEIGTTGMSTISTGDRYRFTLRFE